MMPKYLVIDTETTGLDPYRNQMIQLGAKSWDELGPNRVEFNCMIEVSTAFGLVEPAALKKNKTKLTHIYTDTQRNSESYAVRTFVDFINDNGPFDFLVGFNVQFDLGFIQRAFERSYVNFVGFLPYKIIDPFVLTQAMIAAGKLPAMRSTNLASLCEHYSIKTCNTKESHEAMADIEMTYKLMQAMLQDLRK